MKTLPNLAIFCFTLLLALFASACGPEPTPFPVDNPPTATPEPPPATPEPIRYALAPNTTARIPDRVQIDRSAQIEQLTEPFTGDFATSGFDIIVSYGDIPGWTRIDPPQTIALVIHGIAPEIASIIRRAIDPQSVVNALELPGAAALPTTLTPFNDLRVELANAGRPDGLTLRLIHTYVPGIETIVDQLAAANITVIVNTATHSNAQIALESNEAQVGVITWTTPDTRQLWEEIEAAEITNLYTVPLSYLAAPGLTITYTPGGWPLASR